MTFDARTAEPGSRWRCRNGKVAVVDGLVSRLSGKHVLMRYEASGVKFLLKPDGRVCESEDCGGDIIAPEPEAKPAVPRRDRYRNNQDYVPQVKDEVHVRCGRIDFVGVVEVVYPNGRLVVRESEYTTTGGIEPAECDLIRPAEPEPAQGEEPKPETLWVNCPTCPTHAQLRSDLASRDETIKRLEGELAACRKAWGSENDEICQRLGKVLGYPWFKDDQKNFPGSTEEHGVCVGDHVGVTLVMEGARKIADLQSDNARLTAELSAARERVTVLEGAAEDSFMCERRPSRPN